MHVCWMYGCMDVGVCVNVEGVHMCVNDKDPRAKSISREMQAYSPLLFQLWAISQLSLQCDLQSTHSQTLTLQSTHSQSMDQRGRNREKDNVQERERKPVRERKSKRGRERDTEGG